MDGAWSSQSPLPSHLTTRSPGLTEIRPRRSTTTWSSSSVAALSARLLIKDNGAMEHLEQLVFWCLTCCWPWVSCGLQITLPAQLQTAQLSTSQTRDSSGCYGQSWGQGDCSKNTCASCKLQLPYLEILDVSGFNLMRNPLWKKFSFYICQ